MRCPKCGFISFDHLTSCAKCGKDIAEVASELQGTSIKVATPMFLSTALASFADREESFEEHAMESEVSAGIDFSMEEDMVSGEALEMAGAGADIDFSFEAEEAEEASGGEVQAEEEADFTIEAEAGAGTATAASDEAIEELDFMGTADEEEEEGGLEFDLEDFIEEMDVDKSKSSSDTDIDLDLDDEQ
jgi:hypothetical protein